MNNCIGYNNYLYFFISLIGVNSFKTIILIVSIFNLYYLHRDFDYSANLLNKYYNSYPNYSALITCMIIIYIEMAENCFILFNSTKLMIYHIYLKFKGLTTLQDIMLIKSEEYLSVPKYSERFKNLIENHSHLREYSNISYDEIINKAPKNENIRNLLFVFYTSVRDEKEKENDENKVTETVKAANNQISTNCCLSIIARLNCYNNSMKKVAHKDSGPQESESAQISTTGIIPKMLS